MFWASAQLRSKKGIEISNYLKYIVSALTFVKIHEISLFHEVLIEFGKTDINKSTVNK